MDTDNLTGRTVLITGAGSGIGRSLALLCARRGARLVIGELDAERLAQTEQAIAGLGREVLARGSTSRIARRCAHSPPTCTTSSGSVDLLVNNAGVGLMAGFLDTTLEDWDWIVQINVMGVVHGCHFFLPAMVERRSGHVVNLASMAGYNASPLMPAYTATKYAVLGLSESLSEELRPAPESGSRPCAPASSTRRSSPAHACAASRTSRRRGRGSTASTADAPTARPRGAEHPEVGRARPYDRPGVAGGVVRIRAQAPVAVADRAGGQPIVPDDRGVTTTAASSPGRAGVETAQVPRASGVHTGDPSRRSAAARPLVMQLGTPTPR